MQFDDIDVLCDALFTIQMALTYLLLFPEQTIPYNLGLYDS